MSYRNVEEEEPFIQLQEGSSNNPTDVNGESSLLHCHDLRPVYSNDKAWKKLIIASSLCFIFAVGEVVGKEI